MTFGTYLEPIFTGSKYSFLHENGKISTRMLLHQNQKEFIQEVIKFRLLKIKKIY